MAALTRPAERRIVYPRPPVTVLHTELFREAQYENGHPYTWDDEDEDPADG